MRIEPANQVVILNSLGPVDLDFDFRNTNIGYQRICEAPTVYLYYSSQLFHLDSDANHDRRLKFAFTSSRNEKLPRKSPMFINSKYTLLNNNKICNIKYNLEW